jgi:hypothetical protein
MRAITFIAAMGIVALIANGAFAGDTIIGGDQSCAKAHGNEAANSDGVQYLISGGWILGWLSAANRGGKADWLANVRPGHITELIGKFCRGDATVEQAALSILGQLRMEYAVHIEWKRQTGTDAPPE